jgi:hypothetical protein
LTAIPDRPASERPAAAEHGRKDALPTCSPRTAVQDANCLTSVVAGIEVYSAARCPVNAEMKKFRSFGGGRAGPRGGSRGVVSHEPSRVVTDVQAQLDLRPYAQTRSDACTGTASTENSGPLFGRHWISERCRAVRTSWRFDRQVRIGGSFRRWSADPVIGRSPVAYRTTRAATRSWPICRSTLRRHIGPIAVTLTFATRNQVADGGSGSRGFARSHDRTVQSTGAHAHRDAPRFW